MPRRLAHTAAFTASLALVAAAVAGCSTSAPATAGSSSGAQAGGDLIHAVTALDDGWQQQQSNNWYKSQVWAQLVDTLVYVDSDGAIHPWLAQSWDRSTDGLTYTFHLREDVTFSDGTPLEAATVARNLNVLGLGETDRGISRSPIVPLEYAGAEAVDNHTVVVTLTSPNEGFVASLGFFANGIVADSTLDLPLEQQSDLNNLVASGPFVLESYDAGKKITITSRDDYAWPSEGFTHDGAAYLDSITFVELREDSARLGALESRQVDSVHYVQPSEEERLHDAGFTVTHGEYFGTPINVVLRPETELLSDVRVRQALQSGIDRRELVETIYNDNWKPASSSVQSATPDWVDLSAELSYDPDRSNTLLDEAGWTTRNADGIRVKDGVTLTLPGFTSPNLNTSPQLLELISQQFREIGVGVSISKTDATTYGEIFASPTTTAITTANSFLDASTLNQYWGSSGTNHFLLTPESKEAEALDSALAAVTHSEPGSADRASAAEELQRSTIEQAFTLPLVDNYQVFVTSAQVHDLTVNAVGRPYFYDTWKE